MQITGYVDRKKLEGIVINKLDKLGITYKDYPIDPFEIIKSEGILLQQTPIDNDNIKGMLVNGPNISGIIINSNRCDVSQRFTAMHELSHYWYHPRKSRIVCFEEYAFQKRGLEWQANNAAAYALMPSDLIIEIYDYCNGDLNYMCSFFKVGRDSITYRIAELNLNPRINFETRYPDSRDYRFEALECNWLYGGL